MKTREERNAYAREYMRKWRAANPDKVRQHRRNYKEKHNDVNRRRSKRWADANRSRVRFLYKRKNDAESVPKRLLRTAKHRAKYSGLEFNLDITDIVVPEFCPVYPTMRLEPKRGAKGPHEASPTLDRIDSKKGYIKGNVCVISHKANRHKSDMNVDDVRAVLQYLENRSIVA